MSLEQSFKEVNGPAYAKGQIAGNGEVFEAAKFARIKARPGIEGEEIVTIMENGLEETKNTVKLDENGVPGWVVTGVGGEEYIVPDATFRKKYEIDPENPEQYKPKGAPALVVRASENVQFTAPWGEVQNLVAGGFIVLESPEKVYGIQEEEFHKTYKDTGRDHDECRKAAIDLMGITPEQLKAAQERLAGSHKSPEEHGNDAPEI